MKPREPGAGARGGVRLAASLKWGEEVADLGGGIRHAECVSSFVPHSDAGLRRRGGYMRLREVCAAILTASFFVACGASAQGYMQRMPDGSYSNSDGTYYQRLPDGSYSDSRGGYSQRLPDGSFSNSNGSYMQRMPDGSYSGSNGSYYQRMPDGSYSGSDGSYYQRMPDGSYSH